MRVVKNNAPPRAADDLTVRKKNKTLDEFWRGGAAAPAILLMHAEQRPSPRTLGTPLTEGASRSASSIAGFVTSVHCGVDIRVVLVLPASPGLFKRVVVAAVR